MNPMQCVSTSLNCCVGDEAIFDDVEAIRELAPNGRKKATSEGMKKRKQAHKKRRSEKPAQEMASEGDRMASNV